MTDHRYPVLTPPTLADLAPEDTTTEEFAATARVSNTPRPSRFWRTCPTCCGRCAITS